MPMLMPAAFHHMSSKLDVAPFCPFSCWASGSIGASWDPGVLKGMKTCLCAVKFSLLHSCAWSVFVYILDTLIANVHVPHKAPLWTKGSCCDLEGCPARVAVE